VYHFDTQNRDIPLTLFTQGAHPAANNARRKEKTRLFKAGRISAIAQLVSAFAEEERLRSRVIDAALGFIITSCHVHFLHHLPRSLEDRVRQSAAEHEYHENIFRTCNFLRMLFRVDEWKKRLLDTSDEKSKEMPGRNRKLTGKSK